MRVAPGLVGPGAFRCVVSPHRRGRGAFARGDPWANGGHCERSGYEWHPEQDSNLRPLAPEASALSAELSGQLGQFSRVLYNHAGR